MDYELIFKYVFAGLVVAVSVLGSVRVIYSKLKTAKSLDEVIDFIATNEDIAVYLNNTIQVFYPDAENYDTVEDFVNTVKGQVNIMMQTYLINKVNLPKDLAAIVTVDNIGSVIEGVCDKFGVDDKLEELFNESILDKISVAEEETTEEVETPIAVCPPTTTGEPGAMVDTPLEETTEETAEVPAEEKEEVPVTEEVKDEVTEDTAEEETAEVPTEEKEEVTPDPIVNTPPSISEPGAM